MAAEDRYQEQIEPRAQIQGLGAAAARELNAAMHQVAAVVRTNPALRTSPDGYCTRLFSSVAMFTGDDGVGSATVSVGYPIILQGRCRNSMAGGIEIGLNGYGFLLGQRSSLGGVALEDAEGAMYTAPRELPPRGGYPQYVMRGDQVVVLTRRTEPLLLPVSRQRFLRIMERSRQNALGDLEKTRGEMSSVSVERWLREDKPKIEKGHRELLELLAPQLTAEELEAKRAEFREVLEKTEEGMRVWAAQSVASAGGLEKPIAEMQESLRKVRHALASLPPEALASQGCLTLDTDEAVAPRVSCGPQQRLVGLNPRFYAPSLSKGAVQLLLVRTYHGRHGNQGDKTYDARMRIFDSLDLEALARVLQ